MPEKRVKGYPKDPVRERDEIVLRTYEYDLPFNYPNVYVWRKEYDGGEFHGIEMITQNQPTPKACLETATADAWMRLRTVFEVMPETVEADFRIEVATAKGETVQIGAPFAGVVPADWRAAATLPATATNLLTNSDFAGDALPPDGWTLESARVGCCRRHSAADGDGHAGLTLSDAQIALSSPIRAAPGQRLVFELWARSDRAAPGIVQVMVKFRGKRGNVLADCAGDCIIIEEDEPIVRCEVIGSACTPPGYVMLEAEPVEEFYRRGDFVRCVAPVRFRQDNLWGMHLRMDQWGRYVGAGGERCFDCEQMPDGLVERYPGLADYEVKAHAREYPFAGMSSAVFCIPKSRKVIITGGSQTTGWLSDNCGCDDHYSFRTIRTTVAAGVSKGTR